MPITITPTNVQSTSTDLAVVGIPAGTASIQVQYCLRPDFMWSLAPIAAFATADTIRVLGLNQATRYFMRGRSVSSSGVLGDWSKITAVWLPVSQDRSLIPAAVMIDQAIIMPLEPVVAWSADNEISGYPVRALGRDDPNSAWHSGQPAPGGVVALGAQLSGAPIDTISILETVASESCTITVKAGATQQVARNAPAYSYGPFQFRASANLRGRRGYHSLVRLPAPVAYPFWRVEIAGTLPGNLFVATYAAFGLARQVRNIATDKSEVGVDLGSISRDRSGLPDRVDGFRGRTVEFDIANLTEAQFEAHYSDLWRVVGGTDPVLVVPNAKVGSFLHDRILFGQIKPGRAINTFTPRFTQSFSIDSLI